MSIIDSIFFYTRNDYLIINSLLCGREDQLWDVCQFANADSVGVLKEHQDGIRTLDEDSIKRYQARIFEELDQKAKDKIVEIAKKDIENILTAMSLACEPMTLMRTIWPNRIKETFNENQIGDVLEFKNISSTSLTPYREDEEREFYRYEIILPSGYKKLELNQFDPFIRNEDGEVLLPPMKCRVVDLCHNDNPSCLGVIRVECIEQTDVNMIQI